jgi:putative transposase
MRASARNRRLGGKILDASWGKFLRMLSYKAARAGRRVVKVDPKGTSQNLPEGLAGTTLPPAASSP